MMSSAISTSSLICSKIDARFRRHVHARLLPISEQINQYIGMARWPLHNVEVGESLSTKVIAH